MGKVETIQEFYKRKFDWIPDNLRSEIGHFNIFKLPPYVEGQPPSIPYKRRDFYKIMLVMGNSQVHYADKVYEVKKQALSFSNPPRATIAFLASELIAFTPVSPRTFSGCGSGVGPGSLSSPAMAPAMAAQISS